MTTSHSPIDTLCYYTTFVCHYDQLPLVAKRYQERLAQIAALPGHAIVLAAEEVCDLGRDSLIFYLLIKEILDEPWTEEEAESYSTFMLTTIINLPDDGTNDPAWEIKDLIDFDYFDDFPAIAPTRTSMVLMTPSGNTLPDHDIF